MSEVVKRLRERRAQVWEQAKELADRAADENRQFTAEEEGSWQQLNAELDALDKRIKNVLDGELRAKDTEDAFAKLEGKPRERGKDNRAQGEDSELRAFFRGEGPRIFEVRPDKPVDFAAIQQRTLGTGVGTEGGDTVPTSFFDRLIAHLIETASIMQAGVTVLNTSGGETIQVPKTTAHSTAAIVTEGSAIGVSDPVFGQVELNAFKYGTLIQVSRELLADSGVDLEGYLAMQTGRALGNAFGAHAISGSGASQPRGVVTDALVGVTGGTPSTPVGIFTADDLIDLHYSVIAPYRQSRACFWMLEDATVGEARKLKDNNGQYLWQPSLTAGAPDRLLGKPVITDPNVAPVEANSKSVIFGDFSQYFVRLAGGVRFERSEDFAFDTDLVTFRALLRADSALVDLTGAIKVFQGGAS